MRQLLAQSHSILPLLATLGCFGFACLIGLFVLTDRRQAHHRRMEAMPLEDHHG